MNSITDLGVVRTRGLSEVNDNEMFYQRICKTVGFMPANNTVALSAVQRVRAHLLVQSELGATERSHLVNMKDYKARLKNYLQTKFHPIDAHYMVYSEILIEEGYVRPNLAIRGIAACDGFVVRLADRVSSLIRVVWQHTKDVIPLPSFLHQPASAQLAEMGEMNAPFPRSLTVKVEEDGDDKKHAFPNVASGLVADTPISLPFQRESEMQATNRLDSPLPSLPVSFPDSGHHAQSPRFKRGRGLHRQSHSMAPIGENARGEWRAAGHVRGEEAAASATVLSCYGRVQNSCCGKALHGLWNLVPIPVRNHIVKDFIRDPSKEGTRDAVRVAVVYGVYALFRMVVG